MNRLTIALVASLFSTMAFAGVPNDLRVQTNYLVNSGCSGTLVAPNRILTAAHCVIDQYKEVEREKVASDGKVTKEKVRIAVPGTVSHLTFDGPMQTGKMSYVFKIVASDKQTDLALLEIPEQNQAAAVVECTPPKLGDDVWAVGNSFAVLYSSLTKGVVSSLHRSYRDLEIQGSLGDMTDTGEHGLVQHDATIAPGNSGGALYDYDGHLVGVNVRGLVGGFSFAVPTQDMVTFLSDNGVHVCGR